MKELNELMMAVGTMAGEVHEVTKDGLGWEDLNSLVDVINDFDIYSKGFKDLGEIKNEIKGLNQEQLTSLLMALLAGFEQGKK